MDPDGGVLIPNGAGLVLVRVGSRRCCAQVQILFVHFRGPLSHAQGTGNLRNVLKRILFPDGTGRFLWASLLVELARTYRRGRPPSDRKNFRIVFFRNPDS